MMRNVKTYSILFVVTTIIFYNCSNKTNNIARSPIKNIAGPKTETVDTTLYQKIMYVSLSTGNDADGTGIAENPYQSINHALSKIRGAGADSRVALFIAGGDYSEPTIRMKEYVEIFGGFDPETWQRDIFQYRTLLSGGKERRVIIAAENSRLDGFVISDGMIRGKGAGIYCYQASPKITNNIFTNNKTLGPVPWQPKYWHEMAHDGGAIHCENGAAPVIENNLFVKNYTENGRGAAISFYKKCSGRIAHNVFLQNTSGLNDPARSSDGGAVSIFDWCDTEITNNLFIQNKALSNNDGGAMFVALWSSAKITGNLFVDNECGDDAGALFIGGQEHRYDAPLDPLPSEQDFYVSISGNTFLGNNNPSKNSGAMRFTMESRGKFVNNVVAHNSGIYFQRSDVRVINNTILDNFLFIETKEGLKPGVIRNNILWADVDIQTPVTFRYCNSRSAIEGEGNFSAEPGFNNDLIELPALATNYAPKSRQTEIYVPDADFESNVLANRILKSGDHWGVIHSNDENHIRIWGDFSGAISYTILPTYHLAATSPCIDQGFAEYAPDSDFDGDQRPAGAGIDVGADEYAQ